MSASIAPREATVEHIREDEYEDGKLVPNRHLLFGEIPCQCQKICGCLGRAECNNDLALVMGMGER